MIVKVQRALAGNDASERLLIYDEPRELWMEVQTTHSLIYKLLGKELKGYFEAHVTTAGELSIDARVEDQPW